MIEGSCGSCGLLPSPTRSCPCFRNHRRRNLLWLAILLALCCAVNVIFYESIFRDKDELKRDFLNTTIFQFKENADSRRILLWTKFYGDESLSHYCISPNSLEQCPYTRCEFTMDKSLLTTSDVVVFHGRDLAEAQRKDYEDKYIDMPKARSWNQLWVFLMFEAPVHTWISLEPFDKVFNLTMTYRPDSDVYIPYGRVIPLKPGEPPQRLPYQDDPLQSTKKRSIVAWSSSNCYTTPSRRNEVVHELHKYISIDIYGTCGSLSCILYKSVCTSVLECHEQIASKKSYKFYLAFENSLCESYITEKFFNSLYVGMVPVVYGYGDYSRVAPKGSYIDANTFPSIRSLADYLHYLDKHPEEYAKYFEWRRHFRVSASYFDLAWCSLCTKAWTAGSGLDPGPFRVKNLTNWWLHKSSSLSSNGSRSEVLATTSVGAEQSRSACMDPLSLKWASTVFSFYGFIYYPHKDARFWIYYGLICFLALCPLFLGLCFFRKFFLRKFFFFRSYDQV